MITMMIRSILATFSLNTPSKDGAKTANLSGNKFWARRRPVLLLKTSSRNGRVMTWNRTPRQSKRRLITSLRPNSKKLGRNLMLPSSKLV